MRKTDVGDLGWCHRRGVRDGGRNPGIFYETSDCGDRDRIYGTGISGDQSIFKAADPGGIPAGVPGWKKLCNRDNGKMHSFVLSVFGMTFAELTAGLFLLGIKNAFAIAFIIAVLDILPVLGTGTVLIPWAVLAFASGRISTGVGVFGLYLVITVVRNLIEPKLVGKQMGLSPVIMLPCMLIGLKFFGIIGLFVVPLLVSFLKQLNDRGIIKMFR